MGEKGNIAPTLTPNPWRSKLSKNSGKVSQSQRIPRRMDSRGMASMRFIIRMFRSLSSGRVGRSEERRVGKECRSLWSPYHLKKKHAQEADTVDLGLPHPAAQRLSADAQLPRYPGDHPDAIAGLLHGLYFFSSRRRHTRFSRDWSSDVCSSDLPNGEGLALEQIHHEKYRTILC